MKKAAFILISLLLPLTLPAQHRWLDKKISLQVSERPLSEVLQMISKKGGFIFSYSSDVVTPDRAVSITAQNKTVKQLLDQLFAGACVYKEKNNYIILQQGRERYYIISGYIKDGKTGERIGNATVYESELLASTLTDDQGHFRLQLRNRELTNKAMLTVSKEKYNDMSVTLGTGYDQEVDISIMPNMDLTLQDVVVTSQNKVEGTWLGNLLLSSRQKVQSLNLRNFFAERPIQSSIIPGLGTHGKLGAQVVNQFSFNVFGGYTGGSDGVEIGGLFNIDKKDVQYVQVAGLFNIVGGKVRGTQVAGIFNQNMGSVMGSQVAGIANINCGSITGAQVSGIVGTAGGVQGVQVSGIASINSGMTQGVQVSGIVSVNEMAVDGVQVSGIASIAEKVNSMQVSGIANIAEDVNGIQAAGIVNIAGKMTGFQFGLINIADSFCGMGLGFLNLYKNGLHRLSFFSTEVQHCNIAYKTGMRHTYGIIALGCNVDAQQKAFSGSYGIGGEWPLGKKTAFSTEITSQVFYLGNWKTSPVLARVQPAFTFYVRRKLSITVAPVLSFSFSNKVNLEEGYVERVLPADWNTWKISGDISAWVGWQAGINLF